MEKKRLIIIDSNSLVYRAYYALPPLTTQRGELINGVYGFLLVFFKAIREFQPEFIVACFDFPAPTFRHKEFKEYKAKRPPIPEDLASQIPKLKEILSAFNVPVLEKEGFEADDLIGTITKKIPKLEKIILSGDLDLLQLVDSQTRVCSLKKGMKETILYDESRVREKYQGLNPSQLTDFKALRGDPSDNIPGAAGIGVKTAIRLLSEFTSLENLYKEIEENSENAQKIKPKLREVLLKNKEQAFLSKRLVQIARDLPLNFEIKKHPWGKYDREKAIGILKELEFESLISRLPQPRSSDDQKKMGQKERVKENLKLL